MAKLTVEVVTPEKRLFSAQADEAVVPGQQGLFGVRPGHTPFLSLVEPGLLTVREGQTEQRFFVAGGFVEVGAERVRVLADAAEPVAAIDVAAARVRLEAAQARLKALPGGDPRCEPEQAAIRTETARIAVATAPART